MMKTFSLRLKLTLMLLLLALLTWGIASSLAWYQSYKTINELFDTQQMAFAKRLSVLPSGFELSQPSLTKTKNYCERTVAIKMTMHWHLLFLHQAAKWY